MALASRLYGFDYLYRIRFSGRDLLFVRSCDALLIGCGRIGTIHEFTIAFEDGKLSRA